MWGPSVLYERNGFPTRSEFRTPAIKYFTAPILSSFARSEDSVACQSQYHTALRGHLGRDLEIIAGYYDARPARAHLRVESKAAGGCPLVDIWKLEEKQSDFAPAMQMIRQHTSVVLGLIAPVREGDGRSRVNRELHKHAHWTRAHILDAEFAASHLPPMVRLKSGAARRWRFRRSVLHEAEVVPVSAGTCTRRRLILRRSLRSNVRNHSDNAARCPDAARRPATKITQNAQESP